MKIMVFKTEQDVDYFVGNHILNFINENERPVIGFATGSTPLGVYKYFIDEYQNQKADFSQVVAFNLDEYVGLDKSHPCSFAMAMRNNLFDHINIKQENIHALNGNAQNIEEECQRYDEDIALHPIDIQILGIGMDGHIAYNEPGSSFQSHCHVVNLHPKSIESSLDYGFDFIEDVPKQGVTQGIATIMQAKELVMMAKGTKKAKLVKRMIYGSISEDFPSSIIQKHSNVIVVLDEAAARYLKEEDYERR